MNLTSRADWLFLISKSELKVGHSFALTFPSVSHAALLVNQCAGHAQRAINKWAHHGNDIEVTTYRQVLSAAAQRLYLESSILLSRLQWSGYQTTGSDLSPAFPEAGDIPNYGWSWGSFQHTYVSTVSLSNLPDYYLVTWTLAYEIIWLTNISSDYGPN